MGEGQGRQQTDKVTIYHYDADGTFDAFKRTMIDKKMSGLVAYYLQMTKRKWRYRGYQSSQQDALIRSMGDETAIAKYQAEKDRIEAEARQELAKKRQQISIETIMDQSKLIKNAKPDDIYQRELIDVVSIVRDNLKNLTNSQKDSRKPATRELDRKKYESAKQVALDKLAVMIDSVHMTKHSWKSDEKHPLEKIDDSPEAIYSRLEDKYKDFKPSDKNDVSGKKNQRILANDWGKIVSKTMASISKNMTKPFKLLKISLNNPPLRLMKSVKTKAACPWGLARKLRLAKRWCLIATLI